MCGTEPSKASSAWCCRLQRAPVSAALGVKAAAEVLGSGLWSSPLLPSDFGKSREIVHVENVRVRRYQELCPLILQKLWFRERLTRGGGFKAPSPSCVGTSEGWPSPEGEKAGTENGGSPRVVLSARLGRQKGSLAGPLPASHWPPPLGKDPEPPGC